MRTLSVFALAVILVSADNSSPSSKQNRVDDEGGDTVTHTGDVHGATMTVTL